VPKTVGTLKEVMLSSMVRTRDRQDKTRPCEECGVVPEQPSRCSRCKAAVYCSRDCQTTHWRKHKKTCAAPSVATDMGFFTLEKPQPPMPEHGLPCKYAHSADKIDTNLLMVVHGNGDNEVNFLRYVGKLNLPLTAMLGVRGPMSVGMQGHLWYPEIEGYRPSRADRMRVKPVWEAGEFLAAQMRLAEKAGWPAHRIFLLGHGHGGVVAVDAVKRYGKMLGGVVASGEAVLEEAMMDDPIPTKIEKYHQELQLGDTMRVAEMKLEFLLSQPPEETSAKWSYEIIATEAAATAASKDRIHHFQVLFDQSDFGNARARPKVVDLFDKKYHVRFSQLHRDSCRVEVDAVVVSMEEVNLKSGTPLLFTTGALDTRLSSDAAETQLQYLRRKFRIVEYRRYKKRKDVLGTDMDELADVRDFLQLCSANKPRLEPQEIRQLGTGKEKVSR
jgi:predicted esterase